jgi:hypothetical protein
MAGLPPQASLELVEFSRRAIEGTGVDELLERAAREVSKCLDVGFVKVLQHLEDEGSLLVRAGVGWVPGSSGTPGSAPRWNRRPASPAGDRERP